MAKLTGIEVAKFLAKQSKADRNYIERAARDFKKRGGKKGKRRAKAAKQATSSAKKASAKSKGNGASKAKAQRPSAPAGAAAESTGG